MDIKERIKLLRGIMEEKGIDAYIVPSFDSHQSEYVAEYFKCREWVSGFTGSAGTVVVTQSDAGLWTDGRYYIQAENQLKGSGIKLFRAADLGVPTYIEWLREVLQNQSIIGFDGSVFPVNIVLDMMDKLKDKNFAFEYKFDLVGMLWKDRPSLSKSHIFNHEIKYAGKTTSEKLVEVRSAMAALGGNIYLISSLDDIAWLLNIRGFDVPNNPVVISYVLVSDRSCILFIDPDKITKNVNDKLSEDGIEIRKYEDVVAYLKELKDADTVIFDSNKTNFALYSSMGSNIKKLQHPNITTKLKAIKNNTEIENLAMCQVKDGIAMVKLIKWLKESIVKQHITEITVNDKLLEYRKEQELFVGPSFDSIIGYGKNAAMMHYKAVSGSEATIVDKGFLLIDSGGQYHIGTTDTTRTIVLGELTDEEKVDFTLVLKGFIALSKLKFLHGATGSNLDVIARQPIWEHGMDYKCGTGHGVGFFLNVHEGPHRIAMVQNDVVLEEGMVVTNEPGIYKEGRHGIRTENIP